MAANFSLKGLARNAGYITCSLKPIKCELL